MSTARASKPASPERKPAKQTGPGPSAVSLQQLQAAAGNSAVVALVTQRLQAAPPGPPGGGPHADPRFNAGLKDIAGKAKTAKAHPSPAAEATAAQHAAVAPPDDREAQAKAAHTAKMAAAKPGTFDKAAFIVAVTAAINAKTPKNLDEADKFAQSGKADQVKSEVLGKVAASKENSARDVKDTAKAAPDPSAATDKPVTPLPPTPAPSVPTAPDPAALAPKPVPADQVKLGAGSAETARKMAGAGVSEQQLAKSNEPQFTGALAAKKQAEAHDVTAPPAVRKQEAQLLAGATAKAGTTSTAGLGAMVAAKRGALGKSTAGKGAAKAKDEAERARISSSIKKLFDTTKTDVETILTGLDTSVAKKFEDGERRAKEAFTADHQARMSRYKWNRYGGVGGAALWLKDQFLDLPAEANDIFQQSKRLYESKMQGVIAEIADTVGAELGRAKARIADGRAQVQAFVAEQPKRLQGIASGAAKEFGAQFDELDKSVDEKQNALAEDLAQLYVEARGAVDEEVKQLQEDNKGLVGMAADAVGGAVETIQKLKDMLLGVLARAANAVDRIIKDPMRFLENFVNAVRAGITSFMSNIVGHLKKGLQSWLFGALAEAGIEIPEKFDLKGVISLLLSLLGLTWTNIRGRIVKAVGEPAMKAIETGVDFVKAIVTDGIPGMWKWIATKLSDLKDRVMNQIREFVITKVITAGITWLISLLNPAAAFIKACKMIYDAVMWFVENAQRLKEFADSVLDSVESIAAGGVGKVAQLIENTLAKSVPMLISGLASLLGLGGIAQKVKSVLETVQKPVNQAVDWLIGKAVKYGKVFLGKLKTSKAGKFVTGVKDKGKAAVATVKRKATESIAFVKAQIDKATGAVVLKERFTAADGSAHTLYTKPDAPEELYLASNNPQPVDRAAAALKDAVLRRTLLDLNVGFRAEMRRYRTAANALRARGAGWIADNRSSVADELSALDKSKKAAIRIQQAMVEAVRGLASGSPDSHAPGIGTRAPYGRQVRSLRDGKPVPQWEMTAEHVIPDGVLSNLLRGLRVEGGGETSDAQYGDMEAILIYKGAADVKTNIDNNIAIPQMRTATAKVHIEAAEKKSRGGHWREYMRSAYTTTLRPMYLDLVAGALRRTKSAVRGEQVQVGDGRGKGARPLPTDAQIDAAYATQRAQLERLLQAKLRQADFE
jgi:hypothetical protein